MSERTKTPHAHGRRTRSSEAGYAYIMALAIIVAVIIGSQIVMENLITQGRRQREEETIWRGKQWARAFRLYYHKTGHYPQSVDDLEEGVPDLHFLRASAIKDPMSPDGSWRFIYVNSTGQIIGSVRYATLQQMALIDLNNGQMPASQPAGLPGAVSAASLSSTFDNSDNSSNSGTSNAGESNTAPPASSGAQGGGSSVGGTNDQNGQPSSPAGDTSASQSSSSTDNSSGSSAFQNSSTSAFGQGQSASTFGSSSAGALGPNANPLAQLTQLQPTGPVDGPVIGAFLTGVGVPTAIDQNSVRVYHGAKKYKDWEFIWNPLEDQAQAIQQGLGAATAAPGQGAAAQPGQNTAAPGIGGAGAMPPFGGSMGPNGPQSSPPQPDQQ